MCVSISLRKLSFFFVFFFSEVVFTLNDVSLVEPRGKFKLIFNTTGLYIDGKSGNCFVSWKSVCKCIKVPSASTTKKAGEDMFLIHLDKKSADANPVKLNNKVINNVVLTLNKDDVLVGPYFHTITYNNKTICGNETTCIPTMVADLIELATGCRIAIDVPRKDVFHAIKTSGPSGSVQAKASTSYIRCYKGIQEGCLYPLSCGLLFLKPLLFIPSEHVTSMSAGRGGSAQTRYIDLKIETTDSSKEIEFGNIDRDELPSIQEYVQFYIQLRKSALKAEQRKESGMVESNESKGADEDTATKKPPLSTPKTFKNLRRSARDCVKQATAASMESAHFVNDDDSSSDEDYDPDGDDEYMEVAIHSNKNDANPPPSNIMNMEMNEEDDVDDDDYENDGESGSEEDGSDSDGSTVYSDDSDSFVDENELDMSDENYVVNIPESNGDTTNNSSGSSNEKKRIHSEISDDVVDYA